MEEDSTPNRPSHRPPRKRDAGHYLLLVIALAFLGEEILFFSAALGHAGRQQGTALRLLVLTLGVFLTAIAALYGFVRQIHFAVGVFFGLLLVQPAISALANYVGGEPQKDMTLAIIGGLAGASLLMAGVSRNRQVPAQNAADS